MDDKDLKNSLKLLNYILGAIIALFSFYLYYKKRNTVPVLITLAIIVAGPLEDIMYQIIMYKKNIPPEKKKEYFMLVDQLTSAGFLIFLLLAIITSSS